MATGTFDQSQRQPMPSRTNSGTNATVWDAPHTRSLFTNENGERRGSSALNATTAVWGTTAAPLATRSPSTSPSRMTQDHASSNDLGTDKGLAGHFAQMAISKERNAAYGNAFLYDSEPFNGFSRAQDRSNTSRHSQSSPSYRPTHTASKSTQSQQQFPNLMLNQALNQKNFNHNNSHSLDASYNYLGNMSNGFTLDPNCPPWSNDGSGQRVNGSMGGSVDLSSEIMNAQVHTMHRGSIDRLSNPTDQGSNPRTNPQIWNQIYTARPVDQGLRIPNQVNQLAAQQSLPYYANQLAMFSEPNAPYAIGLDQYPQRYHQLTQHHSGYGAPYAYQNQNNGPGPKIYRNEWVKQFCGRLAKRSGPQPELCEAFGHMADASGEQDSSRWLQAKLATATNDEKVRILHEIGDDARTVMICSFGNYVMQNLIEYTGQGEKYYILQQMKGHVYDLARNKHGCRVVQKAIEHFLVKQNLELVQEIQGNLFDLMKHETGNHVIQKFVQELPSAHLGPFVEVAEEHTLLLSQDSHGCRVIQRLLEVCQEEDIRRVLDPLYPSMETLATNQFGNYVVQAIIQHRPGKDRDRIIEMVIQRLSHFSKNKISSNVVEKCIVFGSDEQRKRIREQLRTVSANGKDTLLELINDQFANYVIKSLVCNTKGLEQQQLAQRIHAHLEVMKKGVGLQKPAATLCQVVEKILSVNDMAINLKIEVDSAEPTPLLTNETNSPQSDGLPSANGSAIGVPSAGVKNPEVAVHVHNEEA
ncbi:RNA-binding pumilio [Fusarium beomiforme]|uniref:RNA-binding pumilio n=1 Tax=Fusarium beomiforme TaxID=44412 RepID=A0A9P5AIZ7_9HYPO|nr:RNA-binding pumilio [Fusarium beomiforme]